MYFITVTQFTHCVPNFKVINQSNSNTNKNTSSIICSNKFKVVCQHQLESQEHDQLIHIP